MVESHQAVETASREERAVAVDAPQPPPLPLRLAGFERYMLMDDQPDYPMTFFVGATFSGRLDPAAFRAAVADAVERNPLLRARLAEGRGGWLWWVAAPDPMPYLDIAEAGVPLRFPGEEFIDLRNENGLRIWVRTAADSAEVTMQLHHTACDGVGTNQFVEDLLCAYDRAVRGEAEGAKPIPRDPMALRRRGQFGLAWWHKLLRLPIDIWGVIIGLLTFYLPRVLPMAAPEKPELGEEQLREVPRLLVRHFEAAELKGLIVAAKRLKSTLNDVLFRDAFLTLADWNRRHDPKVRKGFLRVSLPMNLRGPRDGEIPAANIVGIVFLDRGRRWLNDPAWLLWSIRNETNFFKLFRFGVSFARVCMLISSLPYWGQKLFRLNRCLSTCVLSNIGRTYHEAPLPRRDGKAVAGGLVMETVYGAPPVRAFCSASMVFSSYAGRATLSIHYDRRRLTARAAEEFADSFVERLRQTAAEGPAPV